MRLIKFALMAAVSAGASLGLIASPSDAAAAGPLEMARLSSDIPTGVQIGLSRPMPNVTGAAYRGIAQEGNYERAVVFYDAEGRPFYTPAEGSACAEECLKTWRPAAAPPKATEVGGFKIVNGNWVFRDKPVYVPLSSPKIGDPYPFPSNDDILRPNYPNGLAVQENWDGMRLVRLAPTSWMELPTTIGVAEYRLAPGQILAAGAGGTNPMGKALYAFTGTPEQEKALPAMFKPEEAAALTLPVGDFTIRERPDGLRQWAYKGATLYTCTCDITIGALNGEGTAAGLAPAVVYAYSVPAEVILKKDNLALGRMVEARTGKTLYFRDRMQDDYQPDRARNMYGTVNAQIAAGFGMAHCSAACEKEWKPLLAPKDALPTGYWSIYGRPDGKRQWAYKNAAVYTFAKEGPGALDGNERYKIAFEDGHGDMPMPKEFGMGIAWRALVP